MVKSNRPGRDVVSILEAGGAVACASKTRTYPTSEKTIASTQSIENIVGMERLHSVGESSETEVADFEGGDDNGKPRIEDTLRGTNLFDIVQDEEW